MKFIQSFISNQLIKIAQFIYPRDLLIYALKQRGIFNWETPEISGEWNVIQNILPEFFSEQNNTSLVIFDIGANKGDYSKKLFDQFGNNFREKHFHLHLFEPQEISNLIKLTDFAPISWDVRVNKYCVGSYDGKIVLYTNKQGSEHATTLEFVINENHKHQQVVEMEIGVKKLSTYCSELKIDHIDFLKIDTEGNELSVLHGLEDLLNVNFVKCIQFEFNEMNVYSRVFFKDFYDLLSNRGYHIYRLSSNKLIKIEYYDTLHEVFKFQNYLVSYREIG